MMEVSRRPLLERAYELARSGEVLTVKQLRQRLKSEGYGRTEINLHLQGRAAVADLARLCADAAPDDRKPSRPLPPGRIRRSRAEQLRLKAEECRRLAENATLEETRLRFLQLATSYDTMAIAAEEVADSRAVLEDKTA
jgi:hypothetical protein